jgi:aminoglycoside phosphotransferase (APT) family kinase protein
VRKYSNGRVIKKGTHVETDELSALRLAAELQLPVPRVYAAWKDPSTKQASIEMDFVDGENLEKAWKGMNDAEKRNICQQLRAILIAMRSAPHNIGLIGSCSGGAARDPRHFTAYTKGPFATEAEFNDFYFHLLEGIPKPISDALRKKGKTDHRIVFSHGDLSQHNIIVKNNQIAAIIDWEYAGWYPEYWEYVKFFDRYSENRDWQNFAEVIFPQIYDDELALHQAVRRWQYS